MKMLKTEWIISIFIFMIFLSSCSPDKSPDSEEQKQLQMKVMEITSKSAEIVKADQGSKNNDASIERTDSTGS